MHSILFRFFNEWEVGIKSFVNRIKMKGLSHILRVRVFTKTLMFYVKVSKSRKSLGVNADETLFKVFRLLVNDLLKCTAITLSNPIQGKEKYISKLM